NIPTDGSFYGKISENANNKVEISDKLNNENIKPNQPELYVQRRLHHDYVVSSKRYSLRRRDLQFHVGDRGKGILYSLKQ
ncbi:hypothetical protein HHI36_024378, partial [Cryptolaemus montrouzieri]